MGANRSRDSGIGDDRPASEAQAPEGANRSRDGGIGDDRPASEAQAPEGSSSSRSGTGPGIKIGGFWERGSGSGSGSGSGASASAATAASPTMFVGRILGDRWEVGPRIGLGGMASVHSGMDHRLGRAVAIKILHPHVAENPDSRARLAREARAIAQLKHENVIEVYDYAIDDPDCTWLVTELIEGSSLRQIIDRIEKPMPEVAMMIVTEVVRALRAAHATGVVHRDVKPDNILVGKEGRPKLSDFGIAQVMNEQRMTLTGNLVGSPSYMSPEQANGQRTDHRTDLYSTGILLYRLVTGTLPFRGDTAIETIRRVSVGEYIDPVDIEPGCAGAVAGVIRRALSIKIEERYQSADEMLQDLATVLQDAGLSATWEELPKFFADPRGYQAALRPRLAKELEARGRALLDSGQETRAVDCFNRALSLGEGTQRTLDLVRELSKRRGKGRVGRLLWASGVALGAIAMITGVLLVTDRLLPSDAAPPAPIAAPGPRAPAAIPESAPPKQAAPSPTAAAPAPAEVAAPAPPAVAAKTDPARSLGGGHPRNARRNGATAARPKTKEPVERPRATMIAAGAPTEAAPAVRPLSSDPPASRSTEGSPPETVRPSFGTLQIGTNVWADIYVDGKKLGRAPDRSRYPLIPGRHELRAVKPNCISDEREFTIAAGETTKLRLNMACP